MFRIAGILFLPLLAAAQLTPNSVTVTSSRTFDQQLDHTRFSISISSDLEVTLDEVVAAAGGAGLTTADFVGISYYGTLQWRFTLTVPFSKMRSTVAALAALQQDLAKNSKFTISFQVDGMGVSPQAQAQTCPLPDLIADARAQAVKLAGAAGLTVGAIQAMSSPTINVPATSYYGGVGWTACSLTVRFGVGGI